MAEEEQEQAPTKRMIAVNTGMHTHPDYLSLDEDDNEKTISDIVMEIAEQLEQIDPELGSARALQMRGLLEQGAFIGGQRVSPETRIGELNFGVKFLNGERVNLVTVSLQGQQTGGY